MRFNLSMMRIFAIVAVLMVSCSNKYLPLSRNYQFKSENGSPNYSSLDYWAAHPWKHDPSDSVPSDLGKQVNDSLADVFFLHPTIYTGKKEFGWNGPLDDPILNARRDYTSILYQASVFNQSCRVFAPRYREAHLSAFYTKDTASAIKAFDLAYADIKQAFEYYMLYYNKGRPIIIAAHSQGSKLALRLMSEYFDAKPLQNQLVAAYLLGWQIPRDKLLSIPPCNDSSQTGCLLGWRSLREEYIPAYMKKEAGSCIVVNPLTWTTTPESVSADKNKGSVLLNFNTVYTNTTGAQIHDNVLWVSKPKFPGGAWYWQKNYHIADINLFYVNIRENVRTRIESFLRKSKPF